MADADSIRNEPREFFSLNAKYQVAPGNDADSLMNDVACFLSTAIGILEPKMGDEIDDHDMWACLNMLKQAYATHNAVHSMLLCGGPLRKVAAVA